MVEVVEAVVGDREYFPAAVPPRVIPVAFTVLPTPALASGEKLALAALQVTLSKPTLPLTVQVAMVFVLMMRQPPRSTLSPAATLFRFIVAVVVAVVGDSE